MNTVAVALLALVLCTEIARFVQVQVIEYRADKRLAAMPAPPTPADVVEAARSLPAPPPAPSDLLERLVKLRYVVTLRGQEGDFAGILTEQAIVALPDGRPELILVFEHCATLATHEGDTPADIPGRVILGMSGIAYLQQVG